MTVAAVSAELADSTEWHRRAACRPGSLPAGADYWFIQPAPSAKGEGTARRWDRRDIRQAVEMCRTCPVRAECGDWAARHEIPYGVWGGRVVGCL